MGDPETVCAACASWKLQAPSLLAYLRRFLARLLACRHPIRALLAVRP